MKNEKKRTRKTVPSEKVFGTVNVTMYAEKLVHIPNQEKNMKRRTEKAKVEKDAKFDNKWAEIVAATNRL